MNGAFDADTPAGCRDADIETAGLVATARRVSQLRKRGICTHGYLHAPTVGVTTCQDCGQTFANAEAAYAARAELLEGGA